MSPVDHIRSYETLNYCYLLDRVSRDLFHWHINNDVKTDKNMKIRGINF